MKAYDYLKTRQIQWALNQGIKLIRSKGEQGIPAYTPELYINLFEPLLPDVNASFKDADGNEMGDCSKFPAKMQAVHSSSALGVNVFQYWQRIKLISPIASACGFCEKNNQFSERIQFEEKFPAGFSNHKPPNIDVVIHNSEKSKFGVYAIECKFSEAYSSEKHNELSPDYLELQSAWQEIPNLFKFACTLVEKNNGFDYLYPAQLVKHILGLKSRYGKDRFKLMYLWYDAPGKEGAVHGEEVERFAVVAKNDGIRFLSMTYQELIANLARDYRCDHPEYIRYLTERYL